MMCGFCGREYQEGDHDPCIRDLPGVKFACCGHGERTGYVSFENGVYIEFETRQIGRMIPYPGLVPTENTPVTPVAPDTREFWDQVPR